MRKGFGGGQVEALFIPFVAHHKIFYIFWFDQFTSLQSLKTDLNSAVSQDGSQIKY